MKSRLGDRQRLEHMRDACKHIIVAIDGHSLDSFVENFLVENAVCNLLMIVGEAGNSITSEFKNSHPDFDWKLMKGMRNIIVHEYFGINFEIVFETAQKNIPLLLEQIETALKQIEE